VCEEKTSHALVLLINKSFGLTVSDEKIFRFLAFRNKNCQWWPCFFARLNQIVKILLYAQVFKIFSPETKSSIYLLVGTKKSM
jgi:hypothetical protein